MKWQNVFGSMQCTLKPDPDPLETLIAQTGARLTEDVLTRRCRVHGGPAWREEGGSWKKWLYKGVDWTSYYNTRLDSQDCNHRNFTV